MSESVTVTCSMAVSPAVNIVVLPVVAETKPPEPPQV